MLAIRSRSTIAAEKYTSITTEATEYHIRRLIYPGRN
jgi:hypothetical protein